MAIPLAVIAFATGLYAAWLWYQSSLVEVVPTWAIGGGCEPADGQASQAGWLAGLIAAGNKSAALNRRAAIWTAVAVVIGTAANLVTISI